MRDTLDSDGFQIVVKKNMMRPSPARQPRPATPWRLAPFSYKSTPHFIGERQLLNPTTQVSLHPLLRPFLPFLLLCPPNSFLLPPLQADVHCRSPIAPCSPGDLSISHSLCNPTSFAFNFNKFTFPASRFLFRAKLPTHRLPHSTRYLIRTG